VLDRRVGIPIMLSLLYMEVGGRIGLPLHGISFPGHFLVKCAFAEGTVVLDPYSGGISLGVTDLQKRLREVHDGEVFGRHCRRHARRGRQEGNHPASAAQPQGQLPAQPAVPIARCRILDWIVATVPDQPPERRDRGMILPGTRVLARRTGDFERYLELSPACDDRDESAAALSTCGANQRD